MNIKHLRQQKQEALDRAKAISAKAEQETRKLNDAERTEFDGAMAEVKTLNEDIKRAELLADEERTAPAARTAARADLPEQAKKPFESFGEQLITVAKSTKAIRRGDSVDPRLLAAEAQGMSENVDADGGFAVAPEFASGILQRTYDLGQVSGRCFDMPMSTNRLVVNAVDEDSRVDGSRWGGIQAFWQYEAGLYTGTKPKFKQLEVVANKLTGLCYATDELLEDAAALQTYINTAFPDEFAFKLDDAILNGPGAGAPLGVLTSGSVIVVNKDAGQAAKTITTSNILNMWSRCYGRSRMNACWFINQDVEPQLYPLTLGSGTAVTLLYTPPKTEGGYGLLMGRPVIPIEQAASLGTQGDILLGDFQQYMLAKKGGLRADVSMHVAFLTGEQAFRFMLRLDGQPMWKKPLTPKNGSNTLSPFVTLQAR